MKNGPPSEGPWTFTPECAVVHRALQTAVIADLHLGHEWARGAAGDCVPAHSLAETLARLERLVARTQIRRLIVAGDLVESARPCARTSGDVTRFRAWLAARGIELTALTGNHDRPTARGARNAPVTAKVGTKIDTGPDACRPSCKIDGWTIGHGDRPLPGRRTISGHLHPVFRWNGNTFACFLASERQIVLPAFSLNAAGLDVLKAAFLHGPAFRSTRGIVAAGPDLVLDFGPIAALRDARALQAAP